MLQTLKLLGALSPRERELIASGQFTGQYTGEALLAQMRTLAKFDASNDATRGSLKKVMGVVVVATFASLFVLHGYLVGVAIGIGVAILIVLGVLLARLNKVDISNNFREVALPFVAVIKQDMDKFDTIKVRIDLRDPTHSSKKRGTPKESKHGVYTRIVDTVYHDAWFSGEARLADASVLRFSVSDLIVESKRTKRSSSGKMKTKTRCVKRSSVSVALSVAKKRYGVSSKAERVADGERRRTIKLVRKIKSKSDAPLDPAVLIDTVADSYRQLTAPARSAA